MSTLNKNKLLQKLVNFCQLTPSNSDLLSLGNQWANGGSWYIEEVVPITAQSLYCGKCSGIV